MSTGYNSSRQIQFDRGRDRRMFNRTANMAHWWNVTNWVPRGGRRM